MDGFPLDVSLHLCPPFPQRWRHLENLEKIGQGISGEVYRAWDSRLERQVALKLSRPAGKFSDRCAQLALGEAALDVGVAQRRGGDRRPVHLAARQIDRQPHAP